MFLSFTVEQVEWPRVRDLSAFDLTSLVEHFDRLLEFCQNFRNLINVDQGELSNDRVKEGVSALLDRTNRVTFLIHKGTVF